MADLGKMHADLMRAAGLQPAFNETCNRPSLGVAIDRAGFVMCERTAAASAHGHFHARFRIAADRFVDGSLARIGNAPNEGEIAALQLSVPAAIGELCRERPVG